MKKIVFTIMIIVIIGVLQASIIYVPDNYPTIVAAVNASNDNDEIIVRDGNYTFSVNEIELNKINLILRSENGPELCIFDFSQSSCRFEIFSSFIKIDGFSFINSTDPYSGTLIYNYGFETTITNCIFENNNFSHQFMGSTISSETPFAELSNCRFINNTGDSIINIRVDYILGSNPIVNEIISNNLFINNTITAYYDGADLKIQNSSWHYLGELTNNTFADNSNNAIYFQPHSGTYESGELYIKNSIFSNTEIVNTNHISFSYSNFTNSGYQSSSNWGNGNLINSDSRFTDPTNEDYTLMNDSPCIDAGDTSTSLDTDGTRNDIGCYPVDQDLITNTRTLKSGWNWLCFPRLKRVDYINNSINLPTFGTGKFIGSLWDDTVTGNDPIQLKGNIPIIPLWIYNQWDTNEYIIESIEGFKLEMVGAATENQVGALDSPDTEMSLTNLNTKTWQVGYILAESGLITEVVPTNLLQYEFSIQSQNWCATYDPFDIGGNFWNFDTSSEPTIKCGQMVVIKIKGITSFDFKWREPQTTRVEYVERPMPEYFSFIEQEDYLPLFLELDANNLPQEIGLYIDGECKGAAIVNQNQTEETICQINAYLLEEAEENWQENLEIVYYYGARNSNKTFSEYAVYNQQNSIFYNQNLILADMLGKDKITISMRDGDYEEVPETEFNFRSHNYPNPFNPSSAGRGSATDIYFSLPATANASLEIYNVKGQKIRTLINGTMEQGKHQITWNGTDNSQTQVSSGIYFYRLQSGENVINQKMMLLK